MVVDAVSEAILPVSTGRIGVTSVAEQGSETETLEQSDFGIRAQASELRIQTEKGAWWMPWHQEAMKDVGACDKLRRAGKRAMTRRFPNGATRRVEDTSPKGANAGN